VTQSIDKCQDATLLKQKMYQYALGVQQQLHGLESVIVLEAKQPLVCVDGAAKVSRNDILDVCIVFTGFRLLLKQWQRSSH
jgi:hypothetical protein